MSRELGKTEEEKQGFRTHRTAYACVVPYIFGVRQMKN
jgi:hypothetical protein